MIMTVRTILVYHKLVKNECKATTWPMDSLGAKLLHYLFLSEFITGVVGFALLWIVKEIKWALQ